MDEIVLQLQENIGNLEGEWIRKNSGYEDDFCRRVGFDCETSRYWDAKFKNNYIEIKKGFSIWLDEVRYAELFLGDININSNCNVKTFTIFIIPNKTKSKIEKIYFIDTEKIIEYLKITEDWSKLIIARKNEVNRSLNCQQSMTISDLVKIADSCIMNKY